MPLYDKLLQLLDRKITSLINAIDEYEEESTSISSKFDNILGHDIVIDEEHYKPSIAIGKDATAIGECGIAIGINATRILEPLNLKLNPLPESVEADESYRAWLERITESNGLPSELVNAPPKQEVTYR